MACKVVKSKEFNYEFSFKVFFKKLVIKCQSNGIESLSIPFLIILFRLQFIYLNISINKIDIASRGSRMESALAAAQLHDGYVAYPWQKQMQELLPIPNSSCFLSILFLPKSSDSVSHRYNDLEDTLSRANAWHTASQASGVPIVFMNIQTESLLTKVHQNRNKP